MSADTKLPYFQLTTALIFNYVNNDKSKLEVKDGKIQNYSVPHLFNIDGSSHQECLDKLAVAASHLAQTHAEHLKASSAVAAI